MTTVKLSTLIICDLSKKQKCTLLLSRTIHHDRKLEKQEWERGKEWKGEGNGMGNENTETAISFDVKFLRV